MRLLNRKESARLFQLPAILGLFIAITGPTGGTAVAQSGSSPAHLRRENDQLRERINELEAALEESDRRIEELEARIEKLSKAHDAPEPQPQAPAPGNPMPRRVPSNAAACPDSLYESLVDSYNKTFPGIERPAFSEVQHWVRRVGRDRQRITWLIRVHDTTVFEGKQSFLHVNLVDQESGEDICSNFSIPVTSRDAMRIRNATEVKLWKFTGRFTARPIADRTRPEFNNDVSPKLIGPFAVFGWTFDVQDIQPVDQEDASNTTQPSHR